MPGQCIRGACAPGVEEAGMQFAAYVRGLMAVAGLGWALLGGAAERAVDAIPRI